MTTASSPEPLHSPVDMLRATFRSRFEAEPRWIVRAPGRVNLIGEHTDYNAGFVMPLALEQAAWLAASPRADRQVVLWSENFKRGQAFSLDDITHAAGEQRWGNYTRGPAAILEQGGLRLRGMDAVIWGDVPMGSGLSSSAALEVASALSFVSVSGARLDPLDLARLTQRAEIEFVGVNVGIMDQMISVMGQAGHALLIDCRTLDCTPVPVPAECVIVVADTMKRRDLVDSKYNERRAQCEQGARLLGVPALRDIAWDEFQRRQHELSDPVRRRCRHVVGENARVLRCVEALRSGDAVAAGRLMLESHASLRDDYEVSCRELDVMVELGSQLAGTLGSRMTGAGFGGCTVHLVRREHAQAFRQDLARRYAAATGLEPAVFLCKPSQGAEATAMTNESL